MVRGALGIAGVHARHLVGLEPNLGQEVVTTHLLHMEALLVLDREQTAQGHAIRGLVQVSHAKITDYFCMWEHLSYLVDGNWSTWLAWGACSVTCGPGVKSRSRNCDNPAPQFGGNNCGGTTSDTGACTSGACPGNNDLDLLESKIENDNLFIP